MIHPLSDVQSNQIGKDTRIWQYAVVLKNAVIGNNCNINCHTFIENDVVLGDNVTVKSGVYLWDGIRVESDVFIGPNASFVNDPFPRSKQYPDQFQKTVLKKACSIGANATILGGIEVGAYALIAAGSVVTKHVKPHALMMGNPARQVAWIGINGDKLENVSDGLLKDKAGNTYKEEDGMLMIQNL